MTAQRKLKVATIGSGNIGTDLLVKIRRSEFLKCTLVAGRNYESKGMQVARGLGVRVSVRSTSIVSGMAGVVSTFAKHVERISQQYAVDPRDVFFELGRRKVVVGQDDMIIESAMDLANARDAQRGAR